MAETGRAYWRENLSSAPFLSQLDSYDRADETVEAASWSSSAVTVLPEELASALQPRPATAPPLQLVMLGAFVLLMQRHTGRDDFVVAFSSCGDAPSGALGLGDGPEHPLLLHVVVPPDRRFPQLLVALHNCIQGAVIHSEDSADLAFDTLERRARIHGVRAHVGLHFEWRYGQEPERDDAPTDVRGNRCCLTATQRADGSTTCELRGTLERGRAAAILGHYMEILTQLGASPHGDLASYGAVPSGDGAVLARVVAATRQDGAERGVGRLFERHVDATPHNLALVGHPESLSYATLGRWVDTLAARLQRLGVTARSRVGVFSGPVDGVIGVLAAWKAGATVVPLPLDASDAELRTAVRGMRLEVIVCGSPDADRVGRAVPAVTATSPHASDGPCDPSPASAEVSAGDLAAIVWTGGRPTGTAVMLTHAAVANAAALWNGVGGGGPLRLCLTAGPSDEGFLRQVGALLVGWTLVAPPAAAEGHASEVVRLLGDGSLDVVDCNGREFEMLLSARLAETVTTRSETAPVATVVVSSRRWPDYIGVEEAVTPGVRSVHLYGPPEACFAAVVTDHPVGATMPSSLIGSAVGSLAALVVDRFGRPLPLGVVGELCLLGTTLARGYLGQEDLTSRHFSAAHLPDGTSARLFRTGHLARRLPGGRVAVLGPAADTRNLYGYRVRLPDIEAALAGCKGMRNAAVALRGDRAEDRHLAAFVVADADAPALERIQAVLAQIGTGLPSPTELVIVDDLPRGRDGAIDRTALEERPIPTTETEGHEFRAGGGHEGQVAVPLGPPT